MKKETNEINIVEIIFICILIFLLLCSLTLCFVINNENTSHKNNDKNDNIIYDIKPYKFYIRKKISIY